MYGPFLDGLGLGGSSEGGAEILTAEEEGRAKKDMSPWAMLDHAEVDAEVDADDVEAVADAGSAQSASRRPHKVCHNMRPQRAAQRRRCSPRRLSQRPPPPTSCPASLATPQPSKVPYTGRTTPHGTPSPRHFLGSHHSRQALLQQRPAMANLQRRRSGRSQARLSRSTRLPLVSAMADLSMQISSTPSRLTLARARTSTPSWSTS